MSEPQEGRRGIEIPDSLHLIRHKWFPFEKTLGCILCFKFQTLIYKLKLVYTDLLTRWRMVYLWLAHTHKMRLAFVVI
jgi:hypothetical protein